MVSLGDNFKQIKLSENLSKMIKEYKEYNSKFQKLKSAIFLLKDCLIDEKASMKIEINIKDQTLYSLFADELSKLTSNYNSLLKFEEYSTCSLIKKKLMNHLSDKKCRIDELNSIIEKPIKELKTFFEDLANKAEEMLPSQISIMCEKVQITQKNQVEEIFNLLLINPSDLGRITKIFISLHQWESLNKFELSKTDLSIKFNLEENQYGNAYYALGNIEESPEAKPEINIEKILKHSEVILRDYRKEVRDIIIELSSSYELIKFILGKDQNEIENMKNVYEEHSHDKLLNRSNIIAIQELYNCLKSIELKVINNRIVSKDHYLSDFMKRIEKINDKEG